MMGLAVVLFQAYIGVDQSEQFKREFGPKLWGGTNEFWYLNVCSRSGMASLHFFDYRSSICVAGRLDMTNMTEIYGYVLLEIKICWTEF